MSVLAALGLTMGTACGPCLDVATDKSNTTAETGDTGTTYGPCLDYLPTSGDTGTTYGPCLDYPTGSGDTSATDTGTTDTGGATSTLGKPTADTGAPQGAASRRVLFERLSADGVLPADVVRRLKGED